MADRTSFFPPQKWKNHHQIRCMKTLNLVYHFSTSTYQFGLIRMIQAELKKKGLKMIMQDVDLQNGKPHIFGHFLA